MRRGMWLVLSSLLLGCQANQGSVEQKIARVLDQATAQTDALPAQYAYQADPFAMAVARVPFARPEGADRTASPQEASTCWQPETDRQPMPLEQFALEQLEMKGVIGDGRQRWALIYTPAQQLVKIRRGQYLGLNYGQVTQVSASGLEVVETLPDGAGCWLTRTVSLPMTSAPAG